MCSITQSCLTLWDRSSSGSSVHGIILARIVEWVDISFGGRASRPTDLTRVSCLSCIAGGFFTTWAVGEARCIRWNNHSSEIYFEIFVIYNEKYIFASVQFSHSVMSDSLPPHEWQHARPPCPSPTPGVHSNPCSSSWWCHPTISSSVIPFSSCPQSFPASGSFQVSQFFASGGQSIGVSASISVLPMNTQDWSPLGWTGWISLQSKGLQESSPTPQFKSINFSALSFLYSPTFTSIHDHGKYHSFE